MSILGIFAPVTTAIKFSTAQFNAIASDVNLQNVNGTKRSRVNFSTLINERNPAASLNVSKPSGIKAHLRHNVSAQGALQTTGRGLDLSITGKGFLPVRSPAVGGGLDGDSKLYLTRNGALKLQQETSATGINNHFLVDIDGHYVMGWQVDPAGNLPPQDFNNLDRIQLNPERLNLVARPTSEINLNVNLPHDTTLPIGASFPNTVTVYDSNGETRTVNLRFEYTGRENEWLLMPEAGDSQGNAFGTVTPQSIPVTLDGLGRVPPGSIANLNIAFDDGATANIAVDYSDSTSYGTSYRLTASEQNGFPEGTLQSFHINNAGLIIGAFSNGRSSLIAQIPLVDVANRDVLNPVNSNAGPKYELSEINMELQIYNLLENYHAQINAGTLELSTIDLADVFTDMIQTQHAFSIANNAFKILNDMVQVAYNLK